MNELAWPVPASWQVTNIGSICRVVGGGTPPAADPSNFSAEGVPWLTPADLSGYRGTYVSRGARSLSSKGYAACSATLIPAGSVLFSSRAPIGYVAIASSEISTNQGFKSFVPPSTLDSRYLYYYLRHIKPFAESVATGTTFKELSGAAAARLPLVLAPLAEQKRIADKLDTLLARIGACRDRLDRLPALIRRFRESVLDAAFSGGLTASWRESEGIARSESKLVVSALREAHDLAGGHRRGNAAPPTDEAHDLTADYFPSMWGLVELRDVVEPTRPITYGILKPGPETVGGVLYVRVADFPNNRLSLATIRRTSPSIDAEFKRSKLRPGDILMSIRGTVGRIVVAPRELDGANITQDTARLAVQAAMNRDFVVWYLRSHLAQTRMQRAVKGVAVRGINIGDVRALQVPVPSIAEQNEIVRRVENLMALAHTLEDRMKQAAALVKMLPRSTLKKAFGGELVPQDPSDEPVQTLLENSTVGATQQDFAKRRRGATTESL